VVPNLFGRSFTAGFTAEFMERADGYPGLRQHYGLKLETLELEPGLMYKAIRDDRVDVISGFSTDGRIKAYDLKVLED
ncbi:glycine betaine ABC transporter substrate-binding protein, partial [Priestia sp. SIMBA_032]|uniref:glycine betaine ABC transporter substrate-binding protein n=1 Tax=Priestia sp. SIMBA_032 TaxID=3085775 RepID=UPI00397DC3DD